jgi:hypothetical protein
MMAFGAALFAGTAQADVSSTPTPPKHKLHVPQSFVSLLSAIEKPFTVSEPLAAPIAKPATLAENAKTSVLQTVAPPTSIADGSLTALRPMSDAKDEGFNVVGMTRQEPDATRNISATDTAGLMSWTGKFN